MTQQALQSGRVTGLPSVIIVMGVTGSGKSAIASMLARRLHWQFRDADRFHTPANIEKMRSGVPLSDEDRMPWLQGIAAWIDSTRSARRHAVLACSALKRSYRDLLVGQRTHVRIVYLRGGRELIAKRMAARTGHFMPEALLDSQFLTLEEPGPDENPIVVWVDAPPREILDTILLELGATRRTAAGHTMTAH